jgi:hypothetical protein
MSTLDASGSVAAAAAAAGEAKLLADTGLQMRGSAGVQCVIDSAAIAAC